MSDQRTEGLPEARRAVARGRAVSWSIPLVTLGLALLLAWRAWGEGGTAIRVEMSSGHGIQAGDQVRYRDIQVGEVRRVTLSSDLARVVLEVRLAPDAGSLARVGSRFWVVRPRLSLEGIQGLETLVGARYLTVEPGADAAQRQTSFIALEEPPPGEVLDAEGLEVFLESEERYGLTAGAPLSYRGVRIGTILSVALANDASSVEARAYVRAPFVSLVRRDSRFFSLGGLETSVGLTEGFTLRMDSLRTLLLGGVGLATPTDPGPPAETGQRFTLQRSAQESWADWTPLLPVGSALDRGIPELARARLGWRAKGWFARRKATLGWLLQVGDHWVGLEELLVVPGDEELEEAALELGGESAGVDGPPAWSEGGIAARAVSVPGGQPAWPLARTRSPREPEDILLVADPATTPMALARQRLLADGAGWDLDGSVSLDRDWHGAAVLARSDGALIGFLGVHEGRSRVRLWPLGRSAK